MSPAQENKGVFSRLSSFSVILVMVVTMIVGAAMIPLLNIQYTPTVRERSLTVNFNWPDASAKVIEQEVTARIEGLLSGIRGVRNISSVSRRGSGRISVSFKSREGVDAIRFEIASLIRRIYPSLPEGVTYPTLSISAAGERQSPVITYTLNAAGTPQQILQYAENNLIHPLSAIEGVGEVSLSGAMPEYVEVRYSPERLRHYGLSAAELSAAVSRFGENRQTVGKMIFTDEGGGESEKLLLLTSASTGSLEEIPIGNAAGRIVRLSDVATVGVREYLPTSYYRVNGLNTINIAVYPEKYVNTLRLADAVKAEMARQQELFPESYSALIAQDSSEYIKTELDKILLRTILCVAILLGFVLLVSRNFRYLLIIAITLTANILIAFIFYNLFNIELHLYSLAGVTVSLGIVIDTAIIMIDHYGYYRDRRVFIAILAALLTTIASLCVVFLLPEEQRINLMDFAAVIIINLALSLLIAFVFIPSLMDKIRLRQKMERQKFRTKRRVSKVTRFYGRVIRLERRWRWALIVLTLLAFGFPIHLLPAKIETERGKEPGRAAAFYNKTIGGTFYQSKLKKPLEIALGGTFRLFYEGIKGGNFYREPARPTLTINAGMPEGCTVQQLNEVMKAMENFLSQYEEIEQFSTRITAYNSGRIDVVFKKEVENTAFPFFLRNAVDAKAMNFGGATWSVYGVTEQGFNNNVTQSYKSNRIRLTGYDYDRLYQYAERLQANLSENRRVSGPGIYGEVGYGNTLVRNEYHIRFDPGKLALYGVTASEIYSTLSRLLAERSAGRLYTDDGLMNIRLATDRAEAFDLWHLSNQYIDAGGVSIRLADIATIEKKQMGNDIFRENQQYRLFVAYDFTGPYDLASRVAENEVERLNETLPIGFAAAVQSNSYRSGEGSRQFLLILLIIGIIYFIGAILFESLTQPLVVISLIPVSFIGVFLTFYLTGFRFDQGGFAAFVLLCGIVVNAGFYVINEYNHIVRESRQTPLRNYLKAYNHKIVPILLTIVSTILGLIPFLFEGPREVFWFSFAVGTMGGMVFNLIALVIYLPLFMSMRNKS
jgi:multidrug efflux pump subunit AcrB